MRGLLLGCVLLAAVVCVHPVAATSDGGSYAVLLGVGGTKQRYAVMQHHDMQEGCHPDGCVTFVVDTGAPTFRRLAVGRAGDGKDGLDRYVAGLPEPMQKRLGRVVHVDALTLPTLAADLKASTQQAVVFGSGSAAVRVELTQRWTASSMRRFDRHHDNYLSCVDWEHARSTCSSCREVDRWLNAEGVKRWACWGEGRRVPEPEDGPERCDCSARADMKELTVTAMATGARRGGTALLIEPYMVAYYEDGGLDVDLAGNYASDGDTIDTPSVHAVALERATLIFGAAVHGRYANGTYFPVVAFIRN